MEKRENKHQEVRAAFTFAHGSFQKPERRYIRRQLYMLSSLFALLGLCWIILLTFMR